MVHYSRAVLRAPCPLLSTPSPHNVYSLYIFLIQIEIGIKRITKAVVLIEYAIPPAYVRAEIHLFMHDMCTD